MKTNTSCAKLRQKPIALEAGMNWHLAKPNDIPAMMQKLKELLG